MIIEFSIEGPIPPVRDAKEGRTLKEPKEGPFTEGYISFKNRASKARLKDYPDQVVACHRIVKQSGNSARKVGILEVSLTVFWPGVKKKPFLIPLKQ